MNVKWKFIIWGICNTWSSRDGSQAEKQEIDLWKAAPIAADRNG